MFVSEANFFEAVSLKIMNFEGETCQIEANPSDTIEALTLRVLGVFLKLEEVTKSHNNYKMVLVSNSKVLGNENSIASEGLKNNDELLLVPRRSPPSFEPLTDEILKGPEQGDIDKATAKLKERANERQYMSLESSADFQTELRKVIISIVEAAARVLAHTPQANQIIELMRERQFRKSGISLESKGYEVSLERNDTGRHSTSTTGGSRGTRAPPIPDPNVVAQMVDMGFSEEMVIRALRSRRMNQALALEWLLENSPSEAGSWSTADDDDDDLDLEDDASIPVVENIEGQTRWRSNVAADGQDLDQGQFLLGVADDEAIAGTANEEMFFTKVKESCNEQQQVKSWSAAELLRSFDAFKKHQFRPSPKAMSALLEMGFAEDEVIEALKATGNSQVAACEWLLTDKKAGGGGRASSASSSSSWEEADEGLDPNCPAFKAILAEPLVQLSLTNPKILLAYLSILETPSSASVWINDIDASPVLNQIFKTYSAEKYTLQTPEEEGSGTSRTTVNHEETDEAAREERVES